jgi:hypothetical protein
MPFNTWRDLANAPSLRGVIATSKGASCAQSSSVISNCRFTAGFYHSTCTDPDSPAIRETRPGELWCQSRDYIDAGLPAIAFHRPPQLAFRAVT